MPFLQNELLILVYQMTVDDRTGLLSQADYIYEKTNYCASPLRRFLLDFVVAHGCSTDNDPVLHNKLLKDVLVQFQTLQMPPSALIMYEEEWIKEMNENFCRLYHHHNQDIDEGDVETDPDYLGMIYCFNDFDSSNLTIADADIASNTSWSSEDTGSGLEVDDDRDLDLLTMDLATDKKGDDGSDNGSEDDDKDDDDRDDVENKDES